MITTGIIKQININGGNHNGNKCLVELNIFQTPGDLNKNNYTYEANYCAIPGQYSSYAVGDKVYVGFVNDDLSYPVILGKIYQGLEDSSRSYINCQNLTVTGDATLPKTTSIGDITYKQIYNLFMRESSAQYRHILFCSTSGKNNERVKLIITSKLAVKYEAGDISTIYKHLYNIYQDTPIVVGVYDIYGVYLYESTVRINPETSMIDINIKEQNSVYNEELDITEDISTVECREVLEIIDDYMIKI